MKDLYTALSVEPDAESDRIAAAAASQPEMQDFTAILLDPDKRAGYDRVRTTLNEIAELRFRLGLPNNNEWFRKNFPNHSRWLQLQAHDRRVAEQNAQREAEAEAARQAVHSARAGWRMAPELLAISSLLLIAGLVAGYLYLY
ncbi:hypothetical protein [Elongatibacter sediminis]|uniref:J domain-containing protein n=1 Tax=Elongatibacter sediminis TaxID=3119006 RepID=A0AAW9R5X8_9GAMM